MKYHFYVKGNYKYNIIDTMASCDPYLHDPHIVANPNIGPTGCFSCDRGRCNVTIGCNVAIGSNPRVEISAKMVRKERKKLKIGYNQQVYGNMKHCRNLKRK